MEIKLSFSEKPKSPSKEQAVRIAKELGGTATDGRYLVVVDEITAPFKKLLAVCSRWTATELYIDNVEYEGQDLHAMLNCYSIHNCDGICRSNGRNQRHQYENIVRSIDWTTRFSSRSHISAQRESEFAGFVQLVDKSTLVVDKQSLLKEILEDSIIPLMLCDSCTEEKIAGRINALPETITLTDDDNYSNIVTLRRYHRVDEDIEVEENDDALSPFEIAKYRAIAEIMAPIFAIEIAKELTKYIPTNGGPEDL